MDLSAHPVNVESGFSNTHSDWEEIAAWFLRLFEMAHDVVKEFEEKKITGKKPSPFSPFTRYAAVRDRLATIPQEITEKYGLYFEDHPDVVYTITRKLENDQSIPICWCTALSFRLLDKDHEPVENVLYSVSAEGAKGRGKQNYFIAVSGEGGHCDILPFGDLVPSWIHRFDMIKVWADAPAFYVEETRADFSLIGWGNLPELLPVGVLPHRVHWYANGGMYLSTQGPPDPRPLPARRFYHRSRHPETSCSRLACRGFFPFGSGNGLTCLHRRREARAAATIQRAVRHWLWAPGTGVMYKKAEARFREAAGSYQAGACPRA